MHRHRCCWPPAKMTYLVLVWTTVTCLCWTSGSAQVTVRYLKINSSELLVCPCHLDPCNLFLWFRSLGDGTQMQFLVSVNNADRRVHNKSWSEQNRSRFYASMSTGRSMLRITNVTLEDSGVYSCVSKAKDTTGVWSPGVRLLPGVTPPTPKPKEPVCKCREKSHKPQPKGCASVVLWPLVGILAGLALALLSTLYYFSRLPKKCRHHFVVKGQMRLN